MCSWHKKSIPTKLPRLSNQTLALSPLLKRKSRREHTTINRLKNFAWCYHNPAKFTHKPVPLINGFGAGRFLIVINKETFCFFRGHSCDLSSRKVILFVFVHLRKSQNASAQSIKLIHAQGQRTQSAANSKEADFNYAENSHGNQRSANQKCQTPEKLWTRRLRSKETPRYQISVKAPLYKTGSALFWLSFALPENEISASRQLNRSCGVRLQIKGRNCFDIETLWTRLRSIN